MTNEADSKDDIEEAAPPYGEGLWENVRFWFDSILSGRSYGSQERGQPSHPRPPPTPAQEKFSSFFFRTDPSGWRQVEEEWKRVIPAPHLAARIFALHRIMETREAAIARIARFFKRCRERIVDICGQPPPELAWPWRARLIWRCREVEALAPRSHAELRRLDTS